MHHLSMPLKGLDIYCSYLCHYSHSNGPTVFSLLFLLFQNSGLSPQTFLPAKYNLNQPPYILMQPNLRLHEDDPSTYAMHFIQLQPIAHICISLTKDTWQSRLPPSTTSYRATTGPFCSNAQTDAPLADLNRCVVLPRDENEYTSLIHPLCAELLLLDWGGHSRAVRKLRQPCLEDTSLQEARLKPQRFRKSTQIYGQCNWQNGGAY